MTKPPMFTFDLDLEAKLFRFAKAAGMPKHEALQKRLDALEKMVRNYGYTVGGVEHRAIANHIMNAANIVYPEFIPNA